MEDDDIPDLDDMTELVQGIKLNQQRHSQPANSEVKNKSASKDVISEVERVSDPQSEKPSVRPKEFGGMKKGFLFGGSKPSNSRPLKSKSQNVPTQDKSDVITPKITPGKEKDSLVLDEVQAVMKGMAATDGSWITGDLLERVGSNEKLAKQLADPRIAKAITWMQTDPKAAMEHYKNDEEVRAFFKEFYMILGNHFTQLGDQQAQQTVESPSLSSEDEKAVQDILSNPEIKKILMDPDIQKLIALLRNDPDEAQKYLNASSPSLKADVSKLVSSGVLAFQQS